MPAEFILRKLTENQDILKSDWRSSGPARHIILDDLLPENMARKIGEGFPSMQILTPYKSLRENKSIGIDMDIYSPVIKEITFAFQDKRILKILESISGIPELNADEKLYASGVSRNSPG